MGARPLPLRPPPQFLLPKLFFPLTGFITFPLCAATSLHLAAISSSRTEIDLKLTTLHSWVFLLNHLFPGRFSSLSAICKESLWVALVPELFLARKGPAAAFLTGWSADQSDVLGSRSCP